MRVAVVGATGVLGRAAVTSLVAAGHDVVGRARTPERARLLHDLGARASCTGLDDPDGLVSMFAGADAVCNVATHSPVGRPALRPRAWRTQDRLRTDGVRLVLEAALAAGVRRVVHGSVSYLYADRGDEWVTEASPLDITPATEPASVAEAAVQDYTCGSRAGVVLRLGTVLGDDPATRSLLRAAFRGHAVGLGSPSGWAHVLHTDDVGPAVLAALAVPSGTYNVGAAPVRRCDLVAGFATAAGRPVGSVGFVGPLTTRLGGARLEPLTRSLRVSSELLSSVAGWTPTRPEFDSSWVAGALVRQAVR